MAIKSTSSTPSRTAEQEQLRRHNFPPVVQQHHNGNRHSLHPPRHHHHKVDGDADKHGGSSSRSNPVGENKTTAALPPVFDRPPPALLARNPRARVEPEEDINQHADDFIKSFRKQLEIQRMESIENYHQMLARGL